MFVRLFLNLLLLLDFNGFLILQLWNDLHIYCCFLSRDNSILDRATFPTGQMRKHWNQVLSETDGTTRDY